MVVVEGIGLAISDARMQGRASKKKGERERIQAFENKCNRKSLRIPWMKTMVSERVGTSIIPDRNC